MDNIKPIVGSATSYLGTPRYMPVELNEEQFNRLIAAMEKTNEILAAIVKLTEGRRFPVTGEVE